MDLPTYVDNFKETIISHWQPNYDYYSYSDTHESAGHCVARLIVKQDIIGKIIFSLHQIHKRFVEGWVSDNYEYAPL